MAQTIRIRPAIETASGRRTGWIKQVTSVDPNGRNGYAFGGEFLRDGVEVDLPVGSILVRVDPEGSVKNAWQSGHILKLEDDGEMVELADGDWKDDFLGLRDAATEAMPWPDETHQSEETVQPKTNCAINLSDVPVLDLIAELRRRGIKI